MGNEVTDGTRRLVWIIVAVIAGLVGLHLRSTGEIEAGFTDFLYWGLVIGFGGYTIIEMRSVVTSPKLWKRIAWDIVTFIVLYLGFAIIKGINTGDFIDWILKFVLDGEQIKIVSLNEADVKNILITFVLTVSAYHFLT